MLLRWIRIWTACRTSGKGATASTPRIPRIATATRIGTGTPISRSTCSRSSAKAMGPADSSVLVLGDDVHASDDCAADGEPDSGGTGCKRRPCGDRADCRSMSGDLGDPLDEVRQRIQPEVFEA